MNELNTEDYIVSFFSIAAGIFCIIASILNLNVFFRNRRASFFVNIFGRSGARMFYGLLGVFLFYIALKTLHIF
jgi:hypothetical protein